MVNEILDLIGKTPLVKLNNLFPNQNVFAKLEGFNLTGSTKARSALGMILAAEESGELKPGGTIIESSSGNLGLALAAIGAIKGYKVIIVIDLKTDFIKRNILKAYGAQIIVVNKADESGAFQPTRIKKVQTLLKKHPNSWSPNQYQNPNNPKTHYNTTGKEIYEQLGGKIDVVIGSVGTCGHLGGIAKYLLEKNPKMKVVGIEPEGSVISGGKYHPYLMQGPGLKFKPAHLDRSIIKEIKKVSDIDAFLGARLLAKTEAILCGSSSGSLLKVAQEIAKNSKKGTNIVLIFPDDGFRYGKNFYSDKWMLNHGMNINLEGWW